MAWVMLNRYRPTRTADNAGGYAEALGAALVVYGLVEVHQNELVLRAPTGEDIVVSDIVEADGAYYRVTTRKGHVRGPVTTWVLERRDKLEVPD